MMEIDFTQMFAEIGYFTLTSPWPQIVSAGGFLLAASLNVYESIISRLTEVPAGFHHFVRYARIGVYVY